MHDLPDNNLNILGEKRVFIDGANRICYLLACNQCGATSYHPRYVILRSIKNKKQNFFCNQTCAKLFSTTARTIICENCNNTFIKRMNQINKTHHNFCCQRCAAIYYNKHKTHGSRRSKLEKYLEENIKTEFPNLKVLFNDNKTIGSELDIYFVELKLAIQINGPSHFKPIYGQKKFTRITELDLEKRKNCINMNIKLVEIDVSNDNSFNKTKDKRWLEVKELIIKMLSI